MVPEQQQLEAGMLALDAHRDSLGDAVVEAAIAGLRLRIAQLQSAPAARALEPGQSLKQVSILFLDVVGSTALAQHLDPEAISAVMDGALARGTVVVEAHHGCVLQYAGDNILAAFGVDEAAEDDAERAVRCGLALLQLGKALAAEVEAAHGHVGLDVRVGIHTGGVLLGGGVDADGTIRGRAVNMAARLEQITAAGGLRISHDTYSLVRGLFDVSAPEPLRFKGIAEPVVSYLVAKARPRAFRIASHGFEGVSTRMIGREAEFAVLQEALRHLSAERRLRTVTVVAEAGLGKSRLLDEFQAWVEDRGDSVHLFRGRATPQTRSQPFGLLRDIVAWQVQLSDDDTLDEAKAKIEQRLMPLFADEPGFAEGHAHLLGHLIGLDWKGSPHLRGILDDPQQIRSRAQHAAAQMFRRVHAQDGAPVMLQLEDLHWADDESLDFLTHLCAVNRDVPMLVLGFTRPTLFERRSDWGMNARPAEGCHGRIDLHPLDDAASHRLVGNLLRKLPQVPATLPALVTGGAQGNPFYMEELVRMLIDQGAIDASGDPWRLDAHRLRATNVPSTLTGVLQARLDGLPVLERLTLQAASVIGQVFWDRALAAIDAQAEATLPRLVQRGLALPRQFSAADGMREYAFKHAMLHQVTYGTVLKRQKTLLHGQLADWLAAQSQGNSARAGDFLGLTAQHYEAAGDLSHAAEFRAQAAEHAVGRLAHAIVLEHVHQALTLLDRAGNGASTAPLRWRLLHAREQTLDLQGDRERQAADLAAMDRMAQMLGDDARLAYVAHRQAVLALRVADWTQCERSARRAVALAEAALDNHAGSALQGEADDGLEALRLLSRRLVGLVMLNQGRWDDAQGLLQQTLDEAGAAGLIKPQASCLNSLAGLAQGRGDPVRMLDLMREALTLFRRAGDRRNEAISLGNVGVGWLNLGHLSEARRDLEAGLLLVRQNGDSALACPALCGLSELAMWQGDPGRALALARSAMETAVVVQARDYQAVVALHLGDAEAAMGRLAPAQQAYARARELAHELGAGWHFDASAGLARLALARGDVGGALREVDGLLSLVAASANFGGADTPRLIELTLHHVLVAASDSRADAWLQRAHRALMVQRDAITDAALRQMFLANIPHHRQIVTLWAGHEIGPQSGGR